MPYISDELLMELKWVRGILLYDSIVMDTLLVALSIKDVKAPNSWTNVNCIVIKFSEMQVVYLGMVILKPNFYLQLTSAASISYLYFTVSLYN